MKKWFKVFGLLQNHTLVEHTDVISTVLLLLSGFSMNVDVRNNRNHVNSTDVFSGCHHQVA